MLTEADVELDEIQALVSRLSLMTFSLQNIIRY